MITYNSQYKMIGYGIFNCKQDLDKFNNIVRSLIILSKLIVVQYKHAILEIKKIKMFFTRKWMVSQRDKILRI